MNPDTFTSCGYFESPFGKRLALARTRLRHTADRWEEGEQHANTYIEGDYYAKNSNFQRNDQDLLWDHKIWITLIGSRGYISPQHFTQEIATKADEIIQRKIKLTIKTNLQPWQIKTPRKKT